MQLQCQIAEMAGRDVGEALRWRPDGDSNDFAKLKENDIRFWYALQAFLAATANVSKLLWPDKETGDAARGEVLRSVLSIPDSSPLAPPRILRNRFEHLDEWLDKWAKASPDKGILMRSFGYPGAIVGMDIEVYVAYYDMSSDTVTFLGDAQPLKPLLDAVREVYQAVTVEVNK
jgi:hypothetical protein